MIKTIFDNPDMQWTLEEVAEKMWVNLEELIQKQSFLIEETKLKTEGELGLSDTSWLDDRKVTKSESWNEWGSVPQTKIPETEINEDEIPF